MMRIDVDSVLRQRAPGLRRRMPGFAVRWLERIIRQDGLNELLAHNAGRRGADFAEGVINDLGVTYRLAGTMPDPTLRRVIFVSNHPLGGLDGLVLASAVKKMYDCGSEEMRFVVNDLLTFVEPLRGIFLGVNKHGEQSREASRRLDEAFMGGHPMVMFPAGLVSRRGADGRIADLTWHKMVVNKAISSHRDIIPLHFSGENSPFFYKFARLRTRLGLKFNIEMIRLPAEIFASRGSEYTLTIGRPLSWQSLRGGREAPAEAARLRDTVYSLAPDN